MPKDNKFTIKVDKWCDETRNKLAIVCRKFAMDLFSDVIYATPVKTGWARLNWQTDLNLQPTGVVGVSGLDKYDWRQALDNVSNNTKDFKIGDTIHFTNNAPYIRRLEYEGWSRQAPSGMVRINFARHKEILDKVVRAING